MLCVFFERSCDAFFSFFLFIYFFSFNSERRKKLFRSTSSLRKAYSFALYCESSFVFVCVCYICVCVLCICVCMCVCVRAYACACVRVYVLFSRSIRVILNRPMLHLNSIRKYRSSRVLPQQQQYAVNRLKCYDTYFLPFFTSSHTRDITATITTYALRHIHTHAHTISLIYSSFVPNRDRTSMLTVKI